MATKQLYVSGTVGTMLIANNTLPITSDVLNNPNNYLPNLYFHSGLNYIQIVGRLIPAAGVSFAAQPLTLIEWPDGSKGCQRPCFITDACVESLGLEDNCYELTTLRNFRDSYMMVNAENTIKEYYESAPKVVAFIKAQGKTKSKEIFTKLYNEYIVPSVKAIESGNLEQALEIYKLGCYQAQKLARI